MYLVIIIVSLKFLRGCGFVGDLLCRVLSFPSLVKIVFFFFLSVFFSSPPFPFSTFLKESSFFFFSQLVEVTARIGESAGAVLVTVTTSASVTVAASTSTNARAAASRSTATVAATTINLTFPATSTAIYVARTIGPSTASD